MSGSNDRATEFVSALSRGDLEAAERLLYVDPLESHPLLQRVAPASRAHLVGVTAAHRIAALRRTYPDEQRFFRDALIEFSVERKISADVEEVYIRTRSATSETVAWRCILLRRLGDDFAVDELTRAIVEKAVAYLPGAPDVAHADWRARFVGQFPDQDVQWTSDDQLRIGALAMQLRRLGPDPQFMRFDHLSDAAATAIARHTSVLEISAALDTQAQIRWGQLEAFSRALWTYAAMGAPAVYLPVSNVMEEARSVLEMLRQPVPVPEFLGAFWVNFVRRQDAHHTRGMSHFMLPEVEVEAAEDGQAARDVCINTSLHLLRNGPVLRIGDTVGPGREPAWRIIPGRRGPTDGETYGLWGSIRLQPMPAR